MSRKEEVISAWKSAFERNVTVFHDEDGDEELLTVEGVVIARESGGWSVGVEILVPGTRWEPCDYHYREDSLHPTFAEALARAVEVRREDEERRCRELVYVLDDATPF